MDWQIKQKIASGTFGTVYKAQHKTTGKIAALKLINKRKLNDHEWRYIKRGFLAASKVQHPNCVQMIELIENKDDFGFVMEFVVGKPISIIKKGNTSSIIPMLIQLCNGLDALHTMNIIHRDLKPENILITDDKVVKITDFDFVKLMESTQFTTQGTFIGTVKYASPEQCNNASQIDPRSDLYSLGIILYELVTGKPPFDGESWGEIASQHMWSPIVPPKQIVSDLSDEIGHIIEKLLQKKPENRFANAREVAQALSAIAGESQIIEIKATGNYLLPPAFVDRVSAMQQLEHAFITVKQNKGKTLFITGESGIGKTKLWEIFSTSRLQNVPIFQAQCRPAGATYEILADLLNQLLDFIAQKSPLAQANFVGYLAWDLALICPRIAQSSFMKSIPKLPSLEGQNSELRLFEAITNFIKNIAMMPVVIFLDGLHWADEQLCKWLSYATRNLTNSPVLIVGTYRDNEILDTPLTSLLNTLKSDQMFQKIQLDHLDEEATSLLIVSMLGKSGILESDFIDQVLRQTGGNPLFIQETLKHLLEAEKLHKKEGKWNVDIHTFSEISLPKSIQTLITARLDKLEPQVRDILRKAAVIGKKFSFDLLWEISNENENQLILNLHSASSRKLIHDLGDGNHYEFIYDALRETLEDELPKRQLKSLHQSVGEILERKEGDKDEFLDDLAWHFFVAKDIQKGILYCRKAGTIAKKKFANEYALLQYDRAIELATSANLDGENLDLMLQKIEILERIGKWDDAITLIDNGMVLGKNLNESRTLADLNVRQGRILQKKGDYDAALQSLEKAIKICHQRNEKGILADALNKMGMTYRDKSDYDQAIEYYIQSLEIAREIDDNQSISHCLNDIGNIYYHKGNYDDALRYYRDSLDLKSQMEDRGGIAISVTSVALVHQRKGEYADALENFQKSLSIYKEIGDKYGTARNLMGLGNINYLKGQYDKSLEYYQQCLSIKEEIGDKSAIASILSNMGVINKIKGDAEAALEYYQKSLEIKERIGDKSGIGGVLNNIGIIHNEKGNYDEALKCYEKSLKIQEQIGDKPRLAITLDNMGVTYLNRGAYDKALDYATKSLNIREELNDKLGISTSCNNLGLIFYHIGEYKKALEKYKKALQIREELGHKKGIAYCLGNIAMLHKELGDLSKSENFYGKAIELDRQLGSKYDLCKHLYAKADLYFHMQKFDEARLLNDEALKIAYDVVMKSVIFECQILKAKIDGFDDPSFALQQLKKLEKNTENEDAIAFLKYEQWKVSSGKDQKELGKIALKLYEKLYTTTQNYQYKKKIDELKKQKTERIITKNDYPSPQTPPNPTLLINMLSRFMNPETAFSAFLEFLTREYQADNCLIIVHNKTDNEMEVRAISPQLKDEEIKFSRGILWEAMENQKSICVANAVEEPEFSGNRSVMSLMFLSVIAIPMEISGEMVGALYLDRRQFSVGSFTQNDLINIQRIANMLTPLLIKQEELKLLEVESELRNLGFFIGNSSKMHRIYKDIQKFAKVDSTVYIFGETGTGKELVAEALHYLSPRHQKPFIAVNCASIPKELVESELFGHEKGAFTGAIAQKKGKFELANGGTILLDEIGELPLSMQAKLLRVLEKREISRIGGERVIPINVRILAATHRDLEEEAKLGHFRKDLFYRLQVLKITIPSLRERPEDIPILAYAFLRQFCDRYDRTIPGFTAEAITVLQAQKWEGNVRELKNMVEQAVIKHETDQVLGIQAFFPDKKQIIEVEQEPMNLAIPSDIKNILAPSKLNDRIAALEKYSVQKALEVHDWNLSKTAKSLGIYRDRLYSLLKKHGIEKA